MSISTCPVLRYRIKRLVMPLYIIYNRFAGDCYGTKDEFSRDAIKKAGIDIARSLFIQIKTTTLS